MKTLHTPLQFLLVQFKNLYEDQVNYLVPIFPYLQRIYRRLHINQNISPAINMEATGKNYNRV